jgi:beta-mannanase
VTFETGDTFTKVYSDFKQKRDSYYTNYLTMTKLYDDNDNTVTFGGTLNNMATRDTANNYIRLTSRSANQFGYVWWDNIDPGYEWLLTFDHLSNGFADDITVQLYRSTSMPDPVSVPGNQQTRWGNSLAIQFADSYGNSYIRVSDSDGTTLPTVIGSDYNPDYGSWRFTDNKWRTVNIFTSRYHKELYVTMLNEDLTVHGSARWTLPDNVYEKFVNRVGCILSITARTGSDSAEHRIRNVSFRRTPLGPLTNIYEQYWPCDPQATDAVRRMYTRLSRRMMGHSDPILLGQHYGTNASNIHGGRDMTNRRDLHDSISCDFHKVTGQYPSVLAFDVQDGGAFSHPTSGASWYTSSSGGNLLEERYSRWEKKIISAMNRGDIFVKFSWHMNWPLHFQEGAGGLGKAGGENASNLASYADCGSKTIYRKYLDLPSSTEPSNADMQTWFNGKFANVVNDLVGENIRSSYNPTTPIADMTLTEYRHYKFTEVMLKPVKSMFQQMEKNLPFVAAAIRFLHESNHTNLAFWWNLLSGPQYQKLYQYIVHYLRSDIYNMRGVHNLLVDYNIQDLGTTASTAGVDVPQNRFFTSTRPSLQRDIDLRYPGDAFTDILSIDIYAASGNVVTGFSPQTFTLSLGMLQGVVMACKELNKVAAISELGGVTSIDRMESPNYKGYYTLFFNEILNNPYTKRVSHIVFWASASDRNYGLPMPRRYAYANASSSSYKGNDTDYIPTQQFFFENNWNGGNPHFELQESCKNAPVVYTNNQTFGPLNGTSTIIWDPPVTEGFGGNDIVMGNWFLTSYWKGPLVMTVSLANSSGALVPVLGNVSIREIALIDPFFSNSYVGSYVFDPPVRLTTGNTSFQHVLTPTTFFYNNKTSTDGVLGNISCHPPIYCNTYRWMTVFEDAENANITLNIRTTYYAPM